MTIKQTAGKTLLVLYYIQCDNPVRLERCAVTFSTPNKPKLDTDSWLKRLLHDISDDDTLLYNAFNYLLAKGLIDKKNTKGILGGLLLIGLHLTDTGIDVVEGVEQGPEQRSAIKSLFSFNVNIKNTMTVDSLLKAEVGNIVGIGAAASGKVEM